MKQKKVSTFTGSLIIIEIPRDMKGLVKSATWVVIIQRLMATIIMRKMVRIRVMLIRIVQLIILRIQISCKMMAMTTLL